MNQCEFCGDPVETGQRFCSLRCQGIGLPGCCSCHISPPCSYCIEFNPDLPTFRADLTNMINATLGLDRPLGSRAEDEGPLEAA